MHSFVKRLFSGDTLARCSAEETARWQARVPAVAPLIVRRLMAGLLGFLPYSVTDQIPDVLFNILKVRLDVRNTCLGSYDKGQAHAPQAGSHVAATQSCDVAAQLRETSLAIALPIACEPHCAPW